MTTTKTKRASKPKPPISPPDDALEPMMLRVFTEPAVVIEVTTADEVDRARLVTCSLARQGALELARRIEAGEVAALLLNDPSGDDFDIPVPPSARADLAASIRRAVESIVEQPAIEPA